MTVCPFCKKAGPSSHGPCESCGRLASDHPSAQKSSGSGSGGGGDGWGEDNFDLSRGSGLGGNAAPSAYSGGSVAFDDDPFADAVPDGALELDIPSQHTANTPRAMAVEPAVQQPTSSPSLPTPPKSDPHNIGPKPPRSDPALHQQLQQPPPSGPRPPPSDPSPPPDSSRGLPPPPSQPLQLQVQPRAPDPAAMIARYPAPPAKIWEAPLYALKVLWRQMELRQDLASLRKKRSPDVALYERALRTHDSKTFALGLAITIATLTIASFVFFLPVILRFMHDTD